MDEKNGNDNRDEKGRFLKGCSAGPGRGQKPKKTGVDLTGLDSMSAIEKVIRRYMESDNPAESLKATALSLKVIEKRHAENDKELPEGLPQVLWLLRMGDLARNLGGIEGMQKIINKCGDCPKFPGNPPFKFDILSND